MELLMPFVEKHFTAKLFERKLGIAFGVSDAI